MESNNMLFYDDVKPHRFLERRFSIPTYQSNFYYESPFAQHVLSNEYLTPGRKSNKFHKKNPHTKKKPCSCKNSKCLKLYCRCFANGELCSNCNCKDCHNSINSVNRSAAIKVALGKNPTAFNSKIGVGKKKGNFDIERVHTNGCNCKKSSCLKNYCECYEAKVACSDKCRCYNCRNTENDREGVICDRFPLKQEWDKNATYSDEDEYEETSKIPAVFPWLFLTDPVLEVTTSCLMERAFACENENISQNDTMKNLCEEFGDILCQILDETRKLETSHQIKKEVDDVDY